ALTQRGKLCIQKAEFEKALDDFDAGLRLDPSNSELLVHRASVHVQRKNLKAALDDCSAAITALRYYKSDLDDLLCAVLDDIVDLQPDVGTTYRIRGRFYENRRQNCRQADADYSRAIECDPKDGEAFLLRGKLLHFR